MHLLDTNVISELRKVGKGHVDPNFATWARALRWSDLFLSAITIQELEIGVLRLADYDKPQAAVLRQWLHDQVLKKFDQRILPVTTKVALQSAVFLVPRTNTLEDALIAATARVHRLTVVTRNVSHFKNCGIEVINPWIQE